MTNKKAFNTEKYLKLQEEKILEVIRLNENKLYLELGGKLIDDYHASRVLPGFIENTKMKLFQNLKEKSEMIICVCSENIQQDRIRSDSNNLYTDDCIRLIDSYRKEGFLVSGVALTLFKDQPKAIEFAKKLKERGENVYYLGYIPNYPNDFDEIIKSFEKNDFIETTRPLVIMTSSGSASGKLSACLSQIYNEYKRGKKVGYSKFDIFPIWNLPTNHPLNLAFEAGTADSNDKIEKDMFYYEKYGQNVSNYNRDLKVFPTIREILKMITGEVVYNSPTEMVIENMVKNAITDKEAVCRAGKAEVCRRYLTYKKQFMRGQSTIEPINRVKEIMEENEITIEKDLPIVSKSRDIFNNSKNEKGIVLEKEDGELLIVKSDKDFTIGAKLISELLNINKDTLSKNIFPISVKDIFSYIEKTENVQQKKEYYEKVETLKGLNAHASYLLSLEEEKELKDLSLLITCECE